MLVATSSYKHKYDGGKKGCYLSPACNIIWEHGDEIDKVKIVLCDKHPKSGKSVWLAATMQQLPCMVMVCKRRDSELTKTVNANIVEETPDILSEEEESPNAVIVMEPVVKKF